MVFEFLTAIVAFGITRESAYMMCSEIIGEGKRVSQLRPVSSLDIDADRSSCDDPRNHHPGRIAEQRGSCTLGNQVTIVVLLETADKFLVIPDPLKAYHRHSLS
jgi:hypothetical protein